MEQWQTVLDSITEWLPHIAVGAGGLLVIGLAAAIAAKLWDFYRQLKEKTVFIEITPPATADKTPEAAQKLFAVLHGLGMARSLRDRLLRNKTVLSLEVVSSKEQGIRYIVRTAERSATTVKKHLAAYLPDAKIRPVDDYLSSSLSLRDTKVIEFKQKEHFAFPLASQQPAEQDDPITYISNQMTGLGAGEHIALQVVMSPVMVQEAYRISRKVHSNADLLSELKGGRRTLLRKVLDIINDILFGIMDIISDVTNPPTRRSYDTKHQADYEKRQVAMRMKPARAVVSSEQQELEAIYQKVRQPLFRADIRVFVSVHDKQDRKQRIKGIRAALAVYNTPEYQALKARHNFPGWLKGRYRLFVFRHRLLAFFAKNSCLLAASELASLYHFTATTTENTAKSLSRTLPAPVSLKNGTKLDIVFGLNDHDGVTPIGLTDDERARHVYVLGGTGAGKTTMMLYELVQDAKNGKGFAFLDPHGDAAEKLLRYIPEERINDVIYFNPDDLDYPIGLNLLELNPDLSPNDALRHKELITEATVSIFRKIFSDDDKGGHRIEYLVRNTVQTALTLENPTLFTIFDLLNNPQFRKEAVASLDNKHLQNFWRYEFAKAGDFQQVKMSAGVTNKVGRFLFSPSAERIIGQPKSTIDFDNILQSGKILICNLSQGALGEDTSELFGITIIAQLQMAAMRRVRQPEEERTPFYLYVDEFQNFATPSFVQLLSGARKYKLYLHLAEQTTAQQADRLMVNTILANVGTLVCFRTGSPLDEQLLLPFFDNRIESGEIANQEAHHFYTKIVAVKPQEPLSGETVQLSGKGSKAVAKRVVEASRANYATKYEDDKTVERPDTKKRRSRKPRNTEETQPGGSLDEAVAEQDF